MHPVDGLLEGLKVGGDGNDVLVESRDFELMVLEVVGNNLFISLRVNEFSQIAHVKLISNRDHSLVPAHEFFIKTHLKFLNALLDLRCDFLFIESHVWKELSNVIFASLC